MEPGWEPRCVWLYARSFSKASNCRKILSFPLFTLTPLNVLAEHRIFIGEKETVHRKEVRRESCIALVSVAGGRGLGYMGWEVILGSGRQPLLYPQGQMVV